MNNSFGIKPFDVSKLSHPVCVYYYIRSHDCKCVFIKKIKGLSKYKNIQALAVVHNENEEHTYTHVTKYQFIYPEFRPTISYNIIKRHDLITQHNVDNKTNISSCLMIFLDRCFYKLDTHPSISKLFDSHKSCNLTIFWSDYFSFKFKHHLEQTDYFILGPIDTISDRKRIRELFTNFIEDFELFQQVFTQLTENYNFMVIDNTISSNKITDRIFYINLKQI